MPDNYNTTMNENEEEWYFYSNATMDYDYDSIYDDYEIVPVPSFSFDDLMNNK